MLVIVTFLVYQPAWRGKPILDDTVHLTNTQELRSVSGLIHLWTDPPTTRQYHPLLDTFYWIEDKLWGESLLGYHLVNILLHLFSVFLLLKILRRLEIPGAWLAAAIFALHPVQVESVAWLAELKNTLSGVFFFGSLLVYLQFERNRSRLCYTLVLVLFLLGLLVKTIVAILPAAILILVWWKRGKLHWKHDMRPLIPLMFLGIAAGIFTAWMEREFVGARGEEFDFSLIERFLIAGRAFWFYIGKLFWPENLVLIYPRWNVDPSAWPQYLFPAAALGLFAFLWILGRQRRWLLAGPLFFVLAIFPLLGFFNVGFFHLSFVADHFQYLPSLGVIVPVSTGVAVLIGRWRGWKRTVGYGFCAALMAVLALSTWKQSHVYQSAEACYRNVIQNNPNNWDAHVEIGRALFEKGTLDEAALHFEKALNVAPDDRACRRRAYNGLGYVFMKKSRVDEAISSFERALEADPTYAPAHTALGSAYHRKGFLKESIEHFEKSLALQPRVPTICNNLAWMLATCSDPSLRNGPRALALAQKANRLSTGSNPVFLRALAAAYAENGRFSEAAETAERALQFSNKAARREITQALQNERDLYRAGLPYHESGRGQF